MRAEGPSRGGAFRQLLLWQLRSIFREPASLFWTFAFPLLISLALGLAFRFRPTTELQVGVAEGAGAAALAARLNAVHPLHAKLYPSTSIATLLRRGEVSVLLLPGSPPELRYDPVRPQSQETRLWVLRALEQNPGQAEALTAREVVVSEPGSRYIDFLIPGLLGMGLMTSAIFGVGWAVTQLRTTGLLKRMMVTPMRRAHLLLAIVLSRLGLAVVTTLFFVGFSRLLFDVRVEGSLALLMGLALLGSACFGGLALLATSRARSAETANGLMNLATLPMTLLSGVFFASTNFPAWMQPAVQALPLTPLIDGLRTIMTAGGSFEQLARPVCVLSVWGLLSGALAIRIFRWT